MIAIPAEIAAGDLVDVDSAHYQGWAIVRSIHDRDFVPEAEEDVLGRPDDPAALLEIVEPLGSIFYGTGQLVAARVVDCDRLLRIPDVPFLIPRGPKCPPPT